MRGVDSLRCNEFVQLSMSCKVVPRLTELRQRWRRARRDHAGKEKGRAQRNRPRRNTELAAGRHRRRRLRLVQCTLQAARHYRVRCRQAPPAAIGRTDTLTVWLVSAAKVSGLGAGRQTRISRWPRPPRRLPFPFCPTVRARWSWCVSIKWPGPSFFSAFLNAEINASYFLSS